MLEKKNSDEYQKGPNDISRFIKKSNTEKDKYELDYEKIAEEEKYDGYYAIATNLDDDAKQAMKVANISDILYVAQYTGSDTLTALEGVFGLELNFKYFLPKDLNKKCRKNF